MKITLSLPFLLFLSLISVLGINEAKATSFFLSHSAKSKEDASNIFVDKYVLGFPGITQNDPQVFHLVSHGRPGELLLDGHWSNAEAIVSYIRMNHLLKPSTLQLNIYGCEFGKDAKGKAAVAYLKKSLGVSIAASDNITGRGGDWTLEVGNAKGVLNLPGYAASLQYAPTDDLDGDGTLNFLDIDDDNDGVLDAIEAPSCYYSTSELAKPSLITSQITMASSQPVTLANDNNVATYARFNLGTNPIAGVTLYEITMATPLAISSINFSMVSWYMTTNTTSTVVLQGFNGTTWDDLGPAAPHNTLPAGGAADTFKNTLNPGGVYSKYRIQGIAGTAYHSGVAEVTITPLSGVPSLYPKSVCTTDLDNDGITNDKDLDSDGDGCPDAREAGTYSIAGAGSSNGNVKNGAGGVVTSTVSTPNAVINGSYSSNGFAISMQVPGDVNSFKGVYFYNQYAVSAYISVCGDLDGDGVLDLADIDDDNDGVLDAVEAGPCYYSTDEMASPLSITSQLQVTPGQPLTFAYDKNQNTYSYFNTYNVPITNVTLYEIILSSPLAISSINFLMYTWPMTAGGFSTVVLQGFNGSAWVNLGPVAAHTTLPPAGTADTFKNTLSPGTIFSKYRIQGVAGTSYYSGVNEITVTPTFNVPSLHPKLTCPIDFDNDGITNDKDLDSDGDGCPDAVEAAVYSQAGVTASSGQVKNGSGGVVTSTTTVANAIIAGPYGNNGFSDVIQAVSDTNVYKFNYTYVSVALTKILNGCIDSDSDGIGDLVDIDDDNDGVLDVLERGECLSLLDGIVDGSFEGAAPYAWNQNTNPGSLNGGSTAYSGTGWQIYSGSPDTWYGAFDLVGAGYWSGANNGVAATSDGNVFASIYNGFIFEGIYTNIPFTKPLIVGQTYILRYDQVFGGTYGATLPGQQARFKFTLDSLSYYGSYMSYNGNNYKSWQVDQITFIATSATPQLIITVDKNPGTEANYLSIDGIKLYTPLTGGCDTLVDTDNDGLPNTLDLDSDGDGCPDAKEAGTIYIAGATPINGLVKNGGSGVVSSQVNKPNAVIAGPYGNNGFANSLQAITDTNTYKGIYTYDTAINAAVHDACAITSDTVELTPGCPSCPITGCVNYVDLDSIGATYGTCGAPTGYTVTTTGKCTTFTPTVAVTDTARTCITICNGGVCDTTYVILYPPITPDSISIKASCPRCPVVGCVVADDVIIDTTTTYFTCGLSGAQTGMGILLLDLNGCLIFQGNGSQSMSDTIRTCVVACSHDKCDTTYVTILPPMPYYGTDTILIRPPFSGAPVGPICPTGDDNIGYINPVYYSCGLNPADTSFGTLTINASGCATWVSNATQMTGDTVKTCVVKCADTIISGNTFNVCDTTLIYFLPVPTPDTVKVTPGCPSCVVNPCPVADDIHITSGTTFSTCGAPTGYIIVSGPDVAGCYGFKPNPGNPPTDTGRTCIVACNGIVCDTTYVIIYPPVRPDTVEVTPVCPTCPVSICPIVNDIDTTGGGTVYSSCGIPAGYTVSVLNGCTTYTPDTIINDTARTCIVSCNKGKCDTTYVILTPPITPDTIGISPLCDTCSVSVCVVVNDVDTIGGATYQTCGVPAGYTSTSTSAGCYTFTQTGPRNDTSHTCIVICNHGKCDTTYINLIPPIPTTPDTVIVVANCDTCSLSACPVTDEFDPVGATYSSCGIPNGFTVTNLPNGCRTYTPTGINTDTSRTCILICKGGKCDTTVVFLYPAPPSPTDTVHVTPACDTCGVTACPIPPVSGTEPNPIFTSCGAPTGYTLIGPDVNGCYRFQPVTPLDSISDQTCIVVCKEGVCDTTIVIIEPPTLILPIGIVSFTGTALKNSTNELRWVAVDELNMLNYTILQSADQQNWRPVGTIAAKNSSGKQSFVMIDNNPDEENYYKLSYKDRLGNASIYPKVVYLRNKETIAEKVSVYPNPANTRLNFEYNSIGHQAKVHVFITDITGRIIREFDDDVKNGKNVLQLDISNFTDGSYLINYRNASNGNSGTVKFVKRKE